MLSTILVVIIYWFCLISRHIALPARHENTIWNSKPGEEHESANNKEIVQVTDDRYEVRDEVNRIKEIDQS